MQTGDARQNANGQSPHLSIIIPVYNERESLKLLHEKLTAVVSALGFTWEVIYVDDGSSDGSLDVLRSLQESDPRIVVAVQRRNFGKSLALAAGFALAQGEVIITMDADLQDEPAEIPNLLDKLSTGFDVVMGWRHQRRDPLGKLIPSWVANNVTTLMTGLKVHDMNSGFKAYRADCVRQIRVYGDLHRYIPILAHYAGFRVGESPVVHHERQFGKSKYGVGRFIRGGLDLITVLFLNQYGRRPLHLFGSIGAVLFLAGVVINVLLTLEWLQGIRPIGNRPALLLGVLLMLIGFQVLSVGLVAELLVAFIQKNESPLATLHRIYRSPVSESQPTELSQR